jgi:hypothetical protein
MYRIILKTGTITILELQGESSKAGRDNIRRKVHIARSQFVIRKYVEPYKI